MANVFDTAKYILHQKGTMSTWKLQKLCYYSQAWSIAWTEEPLFDEDFEAWRNGPVCRELFYAHQGRFTVNECDIKAGSIENLKEGQRETIDIVVRDYGEMEPFALRELTHSEDPWIIARGGLPEEASCSTVITKESMGRYYGSL